MGYVFDDLIELPFLTDKRRPDKRYDGLVVRARSVPNDVMTRASELTEGGLDVSHANAAAVAEVLELVAASLVDWNLTERDGTEVPCTLEGLNSRPHVLQFAVINAWTRGQLEISPDFGDGSASGDGAVPIPMEPLAS